MPCNSMLTTTDKSGTTVTVRCGQCLHCRIQKKSSLTLRNLLEFNSALSGQFVTLTYSEDPGLLQYSDIQKFLRSLRKENRKAGNSATIRFFCCGEYGTKSERGHWHLLLYNALSLPEGLSHIKSWPHGFAFVGQITTASIGYTVAYTTKFSDQARPEIGKWSLRPALGAYGLDQVARIFATQNIPVEGLSCMTFSGKKYAMDQWTKERFVAGYLAHGGSEKNLPITSKIALDIKRKLELLITQPIPDEQLARHYTKRLMANEIRLCNGDL